MTETTRDVEGLEHLLEELANDLAVDVMTDGSIFVSDDVAVVREAAAEIRRLRSEVQRAREERDFYNRLFDERHAALERVEAELERIQRLPAKEWAEVTAAIMSEAAKAARAGYQPNARAMKDALDAGKVYVARIEAELERANAALRAKADEWEGEAATDPNDPGYELMERLASELRALATGGDE